MARRPLTREQRRRAGYKLDPLEARSVRLPPKTWEKLGWLAESRGLQQSDLIRSLLGDAVIGVLPPKSYKTGEIQAPDTDWKAWNDAADKLGVPIDKLIIDTMRKITRVVLDID